MYLKYDLYASVGQQESFLKKSNFSPIILELELRDSYVTYL